MRMLGFVANIAHGIDLTNAVTTRESHVTAQVSKL